MNRWLVDKNVLRDWSWRGWASVAALLALSLFGPDETWRTSGAHGVTTLVSLVVFFLAWNKGSLRPMGVQVRLGVLILLGLGVAPSLRWVHALPLVSVSSLVLFGYSPMQRLLLLMPWNRTQRLTPRFVVSTMLAAPHGSGLIRCRQRENEVHLAPPNPHAYPLAR